MRGMRNAAPDRRLPLLTASCRAMLLRMTDPYGEAHRAARSLALARWGNQVPVRAARTVIDRADELPASLRAEVIGALSERKDTAGE